MKGSDLKSRLNSCGYTMTFIANKLGVLPQNLNSWFNSNDVRTGTIEKLAEVLDLPISYFYGEEAATTTNVSGSNNATAINNSIATANDDRLLTLLLNKDEQLLKSMEQTTLAMQQTSKAQEQLGEIIAELRKR